VRYVVGAALVVGLIAAALHHNGGAANEPVAVGLYPRGAFEWCPSLAGTLSTNVNDVATARSVAVAFDLALHRGARQTLARLEDPTIVDHTRVRDAKRAVLDPDRWAATWLASGVQVVGEGPGSGMAGLASYGCGPAVAARTWIVAVHDASHTNSAGGAAYFLDHRRSGWRVWGSY
jgi:hypothetical protein